MHISHLSLIIILNKICCYSLRSSLWEIFYKIAVVKQFKYACESVLFLLKLQAIGLQLYLLKSNFFTVIFFKDFNHTASLMLNRYFEEHLSIFAEHLLNWLLCIHQIRMINTYFFLLLRFLNAITKSRQINWKIERTKTYHSMRYCKYKVASCKLGILQLQKL